MLPRVADAAVDLAPSFRIRRAASPAAALAEWHASVAVAGRRRRTSSRAYCTAAVARWSASDMSASLCWIAWNEPIGRSNCLRSFAYASAMSKMRRAVPVISAAIDTCARSRQAANASGSTGCASSSRSAASSVNDAAREVDGRDEAQAVARPAASTTATVGPGTDDRDAARRGRLRARTGSSGRRGTRRCRWSRRRRR